RYSLPPSSLLPQARRRLALCQTRLSSARWQSLCSTSPALSGSMPPPNFVFAAPHPSVVSRPPLPATPCITRLPSQVLNYWRLFRVFCALKYGAVDRLLAPAKSSTEQATSVSWPCLSATPSPLVPISPALASCPPSTSSNGSCLASTLLLSSFADAHHVECRPPSSIRARPQLPLSPSPSAARTSPSILPCLRQCCNEVPLPSRASPPGPPAPPAASMRSAFILPCHWCSPPCALAPD
ncbi:hypothetical protein B0H13DRAFT_2502119, partial [Mycena leptocephala]